MLQWFNALLAFLFAPFELPESPERDAHGFTRISVAVERDPRPLHARP